MKVDNLQIVKLLLENGADVNAKNLIQKSPLMIACLHNKNIDIIEFLLKHGASLNEKDLGNKTLLHLASISNDANVV